MNDYDNQRHAIVEGLASRLETIQRYLPSGYLAEAWGDDVWIHGEDNAGWTLDEYVIPRLGSGLLFAREITGKPNRRLALTAEHVDFAESMLVALMKANALDGYFAEERSGVYGKVKAALVTALAAAIVTDTEQPLFWGDAEKIARRLYEEAIDNGENIAYQLELWNTDRINESN